VLTSIYYSFCFFSFGERVHHFQIRGTGKATMVQYQHFLLAVRITFMVLNLSIHLLLVTSGSSTIKIKDDKTGATYTVDSHDIASGWRFQWHKPLVLLLVTMGCVCLIP
jgi:hypothetical protein